MRTIKSKRDFERVFTRGTRRSHRLVRITVLGTHKGDLGRVAFVAPKRLGNAVFRNRCKRVLRHAAYQCELPLEGFDIILMATNATHDANPQEVGEAIDLLLHKARVLHEQSSSQE